MNSQNSQPKFLVKLIKPSLDNIIVTENFELHTQISKFLVSMVKDFDTHEEYIKWNPVFTFMVNNSHSPYLMAKIHAYLYSNPKSRTELLKPVTEDNEVPNSALLRVLKQNADHVTAHYAKVATIYSVGKKIVQDLVQQRSRRQTFNFLSDDLIKLIAFNSLWISFRLILKNKSFSFTKLKSILRSNFLVPFVLSSSFIIPNLVINLYPNRKFYHNLS